MQYWDDTFLVESSNKVLPVMTLSVGANYFVSRFFNFYASATYVKGKFIKEVPAPINLNELRLSLGLGLNIHARSK